MKSVFFLRHTPGGGTSGPSAKVITDVLTFNSASGMFRDPGFRLLICENGRIAGLSFERGDADPFSLALSMYLAHYENGLDFWDMRRNRGVGTFGGSEDHTAIILGERDRMLFCRDFTGSSRPTERAAPSRREPGSVRALGDYEVRRRVRGEPEVRRPAAFAPAVDTRRSFRLEYATCRQHYPNPLEGGF